MSFIAVFITIFQVEEEMKISLRIRIKPLDLDSMDSDELKNKAQKIFDTILQLETDKYDYEQRQLDQVRFSSNCRF